MSPLTSPSKSDLPRLELRSLAGHCEAACTRLPSSHSLNVINKRIKVQILAVCQVASSMWAATCSPICSQTCPVEQKAWVIRQGKQASVHVLLTFALLWDDVLSASRHVWCLQKGVSWGPDGLGARHAIWTLFLHPRSTSQSITVHIKCHTLVWDPTFVATQCRLNTVFCLIPSFWLSLSTSTGTSRIF